MHTPDRWVPFAGWFLAVSYAVGAPLTAILEYRGQMLSQRFEYSPWLIYLTCAMQALCAIGILLKPTRVAAAAALTVITLGAFASHLRIGSPATSGPAILYTAIQAWFGLRSRDTPRRPRS